MKIYAFLILFLILLTACTGTNISVAAGTPQVTPSAPPAIRSVTPLFVPSATLTASVPPDQWTPTETPTETPTASPTPTVTRTPSLLAEISGCNTSLDVLHGMGEVTNAYPLLQNVTGADLTNVCATLSASDEDRTHPDKTVCIPSLPDGYQVVLKLTVDTGFQEDTSVQVSVTSTEGWMVSAAAESCRDIGLPGWVPEKAGELEPIP